MTRFAFAIVWASLVGSAFALDAPIRVLIVDGQNNHAWDKTTPILRQCLLDSQRFTVDVATAPPRGGDLSTFRPKFADHQVVLSNYNGDDWSESTRADFVAFVKRGGGVVIIHAANNSFPKWKEYNEIIGLGGWGGRNEAAGPYVRFRDGQIVRDTTPGPGGHHGRQHPFPVVIREPNHPITAGLPRVWFHASDELYDKLRGPALNMNVLATAYADPATGGSGEHEPMAMTLTYGQGRVFHTPLGHSPEAMKCVGFQVLVVRGTEWAATGKVQVPPLPDDFPPPDEVRVRP